MKAEQHAAVHAETKCVVCVCTCTCYIVRTLFLTNRVRTFLEYEDIFARPRFFKDLLEG